MSLIVAVFYFAFLIIHVSIFLGLYILINKAEQKRLFEILKNQKLPTVFAGLLVVYL